MWAKIIEKDPTDEQEIKSWEDQEFPRFSPRTAEQRGVVHTILETEREQIER